MILYVLLLSCGFVEASQHVLNPAEFPKTTELRKDLAGVIGESNSLKTCIHKVASPLDKAIKFAKDVAEISDKIKKIEQRTEVTIGIMEAAMLIPYVGQAAAIVLQPAITVMNVIQSGLKKVEPVVHSFAGKLHQWTEPLKTVKTKVDWVSHKIDDFSKAVYLVENKAAAAEGCANSLPAGRKTAIHAVEGVAGKLDVVPDGFNKVFGAVNHGCSKVEGALHKVHLVRRRRGLPSLSKVTHVLDAILKAFGPLGHFLDKVDHVLHKKFCLLHSLEQLVKEAAKVGVKVVEGAEHLGKEVIKGAKHIVDEAGHVWVEIDQKAEHIIHDLGHGIEHVGKEVVKGVEHVAHEIGDGAEHVAHEVVKGAEHVAHEIGDGAEHVVHEVGSGVKHVVHEVTDVVHNIGHALHHIFGRRAVAEKVYLIDGKLYVLVDGGLPTRTRRGIDVCVSVSDILKGVNLVTGGLMSKATDLIKGLFHGKSPFHIPGLTSDVLNIGSLFHHIDFASLLPSAKDLLKLPQLDMEKIIHLNVKLFEQMLPQCKAAIAKVHWTG